MPALVQGHQCFTYLFLHSNGAHTRIPTTVMGEGEPLQSRKRGQSKMERCGVKEMKHSETNKFYPHTVDSQKIV